MAISPRLPSIGHRKPFFMRPGLPDLRPERIGVSSIWMMSLSGTERHCASWAGVSGGGARCYSAFARYMMNTLVGPSRRFLTYGMSVNGFLISWMTFGSNHL